jgi:hypothetical protein
MLEERSLCKVGPLLGEKLGSVELTDIMMGK